MTQAMYISKWVLAVIAALAVWIIRRTWNRERWLRHCYVDLSDWTHDALPSPDAPEIARQEASSVAEWGARVARHKRLLAQAGVYLTADDALSPE